MPNYPLLTCIHLFPLPTNLFYIPYLTYLLTYAPTQCLFEMLQEGVSTICIYFLKPSLYLRACYPPIYRRSYPTSLITSTRNTFVDKESINPLPYLAFQTHSPIGLDLLAPLYSFILGGTAIHPLFRTGSIHLTLILLPSP